MPVGVGYWHESDGVTVTRGEAERAWRYAAHERLLQLAKSYHATIEYGQLAEEIQDATGIRTAVPMRHWIGGLLGQVEDFAHAEGEPPLTALVVQKGTGMVGEGYDYVLKVRGLDPIHDPVERENHAALSRLECHQWAGVPEPAGGWKAALAPALQRARDWKTKQATPAKPTALCPRCHMALPLSGQCDNCD